jgi:hypothetical protein
MKGVAVRNPEWILHAACVNALYNVMQYRQAQRPHISLQESMVRVFDSSYARALDRGRFARHDLQALKDFAGDIACNMACNGMLDYGVHEEPETGRLCISVVDTELREHNCIQRCLAVCAALLARRRWPWNPPADLRKLVARMVWDTRRDPDVWSLPDPSSSSSSGEIHSSKKARVV